MKPVKQSLALLLAVLIGAPSFAAESPFVSFKSPRIAVIDLAVPESHVTDRRVLRDSIFRAFEGHSKGKVQMISLERIHLWRERRQKEAQEPTATEQLRDARKLLAKGKKAYESLQMKLAMQTLGEARREFILHLPALRSNRDLLDAHLYLGMTYVALKEKEKAKEEFRRVVYLDPTRELSSKDYSPQVIEAFSKARREVMGEDPIRVNIQSDPAAARIYLNGRSVGNTPTQLRLQPGEYFILVEKEGMRPWYEPIRLEKRMENVRATLNPALVDLQWANQLRVREGGSQESEEVEFIKESAVELGADLVFLGTLTHARNYRFLGQFYDSRTAEFSQVAVVAMGDDLSEFPDAAKDLVETLMGFVRPDGYLMSHKPSTLEAPSPLRVGGEEPSKEQVLSSAVPGKRWYEHWWIYPILAVAGAGIYLGATELGSSSGSKIIIDNQGNF